MPRSASIKSDAVMRSSCNACCRISPRTMTVIGLPNSSCAYRGQNQARVEFKISSAVSKKIGTMLAASGKSGSIDADGRYVGDEKGGHQLGGLQFPQLPLAHQPHGGDNGNINNDSAQKRWQA